MATNKKTSTSCYRGTLKAETTLTDDGQVPQKKMREYEAIKTEIDDLRDELGAKDA